MASLAKCSTEAPLAKPPAASMAIIYKLYYLWQRDIHTNREWLADKNIRQTNKHRARREGSGYNVGEGHASGRTNGERRIRAGRNRVEEADGGAAAAHRRRLPPPARPHPRVRLPGVPRLLQQLPQAAALGPRGGRAPRRGRPGGGRPPGHRPPLVRELGCGPPAGRPRPRGV